MCTVLRAIMAANDADDRHFLRESIETGVFVLILRPHEAEEAPHIGKTPAPGCVSVHSGISAIYFARPYNKRIDIANHQPFIDTEYAAVPEAEEILLSSGKAVKVTVAAVSVSPHAPKHRGPPSFSAGCV